MLFREQPTSDGYCYHVKDVFGEIELCAPEPLDAAGLDALTMHVIKIGMASGTINDVITYSFKKADAWLEEEPVIH